MKPACAPIWCSSDTISLWASSPARVANDTVAAVAIVISSRTPYADHTRVRARSRNRPIQWL